jgi:Zn-dependent protease
MAEVYPASLCLCAVSMLFRVFDELQIDPLSAVITFAAFVVALVVGITFHEFSHALAAFRLGDFTAKRLGRLNLNPKSHLDPMGTLLILFAGFGWGRPTPVNPMNLRIGERAGMAIVSLAGPVSNVIIAAILALPFRLGIMEGTAIGFIPFSRQPFSLESYILGSLIFWNLLLAAFNLIPIAPLDGFKVVLGILPRHLAVSFARLEQYGPFILLFVIFADILLAPLGIYLGILPRIIFPILEALAFVVLGSNG